MQSLEEICASDCLNLLSIDPIANLQNISGIYMTNLPHILSLRALSYCKSLKTLYCSITQMKNPVLQLASLRYLTIKELNINSKEFKKYETYLKHRKGSNPFHKHIWNFLKTEKMVKKMINVRIKTSQIKSDK
jgi:hypothetical protein